MLQELHGLRSRLSSKYDGVCQTLVELLRRSDALVAADTQTNSASNVVTREQCDMLASRVARLDAEISAGIHHVAARLTAGGKFIDAAGTIKSQSHAAHQDAVHSAVGASPATQLLASFLPADLDMEALLWGMSVLYARVRNNEERLAAEQRAAEVAAQQAEQRLQQQQDAAQQQDQAGGAAVAPGEQAQKQAAASACDGVWKAPDEFQRSTRKYWVRPEHVFAIKCEIVKHLPVLVYGKGDAMQRKECRDVDIPSLRKQSAGVSGLVSSVYYDNPQLDVYDTRVRKEDGARLVRLRWYGKQKSDPDNMIFVEHKIHREPYSGEMSCKERAGLPQRFIERYVSGDASVVEKVYKAGDESHARLLRIQEYLTSLHQEPHVRTEYRRTAFQQYDNNDTRISFDHNMLLIRERGAPRGSGAAGWCRNPDVPLRRTEVIQFPYAILEIKLGGERGSTNWTKAITRSGLAIEAEGFSKFQHGIALLYPRELRNTPSYFVPNDANCMEPATIDELKAYNSTRYREEDDDDDGEEVAPMILPRPPTETNARVEAAAAPAAPAAVGIVPVPTPTVAAGVAAAKLPPGQRWRFNADGRSPVKQLNGAAACMVAPQSGGPHMGIDMRVVACAAAAATPADAASTRVLQLPQSALAVKMPPSQGDNGAAAQKRGGGAMRRLGEFFSRRGARVDAVSTPPPGGKGGDTATDGKDPKGTLPRPARAQAIVRTRIEPKTFFAAERTFMNWLNIAVLLMLTGLSLLSGGASLTQSSDGTAAGMVCNTTCHLTKIAGSLICSISILFMIYALFMYKMRSIQILRRDNVRYDDQRGPVALTLLLIFAVSISFALTMRAAAV